MEYIRSQNHLELRETAQDQLSARKSKHYDQRQKLIICQQSRTVPI